MNRPLHNEFDKICAEFAVVTKPKFTSVQVTFPEGNFIVLTEKEWDKRTEEICKRKECSIRYLYGAE